VLGGVVAVNAIAPDQTFLDEDHAGDRDDRELAELFKAHTSPAFTALLYHRLDLGDPGEPSVSLATCEKVPTISGADGESRGENHQKATGEGGYLKGDAGGEPRQITAATEAIRISISRSRERQRKVLALIGAGEPAHAKRLANCRRQSVQLECPPMAGGCGSDENYVPVSCDSRLCPDCMKRRQGRLVEKYAPVVGSWDHPTTFRLGSPKRVKPERVEAAIDALRGAMGRLRRRKIQPNGEGWTWKDWKSALIAVGQTDLARRWQKRYVDQGKWIPFDEVVRSGFYAIDVKQGADGLLNVHAHFLADVPWLPQEALSALWGDLHAAPVVNIQRVDGRGEEDIEDAVIEAVGYAAKAPEFQTAEAEAEYLTALKGSKLVQPFGDLHGNTPDVVGMLRCCDCEQSPAYWNYLEVVGGEISTALVGSAPDGDRPPPD
jgi:hypothetical protein